MSYGKKEKPCEEYRPWKNNEPLCGDCAWEKSDHKSIMKPENLKIIRAACITANPSILDLVFGCEVSHASGKMTIVSDYYSDMDIKLFTLRGEAGNVFRESQKIAKQYYKVLGRPIRLADVLVAIDSFLRENTMWSEETTRWYWAELLKLWNLRADRLEDQSEECLAFFAELLK